VDCLVDLVREMYSLANVQGGSAEEHGRVAPHAHCSDAGRGVQVGTASVAPRVTPTNKQALIGGTPDPIFHLSRRFMRCLGNIKRLHNKKLISDADAAEWDEIFEFQENQDWPQTAGVLVSPRLTPPPLLLRPVVNTLFLWSPVGASHAETDTTPNAALVLLPACHILSMQALCVSSLCLVCHMVAVGFAVGMPA
jgi:hypothetical protein